MEYFVFVLGNDLLHDDIKDIPNDIAFTICTKVYLKFLQSDYSFWECSTYTALSRYVSHNKDEIKAIIDEER